MPTTEATFASCLEASFCGARIWIARVQRWISRRRQTILHPAFVFHLHVRIILPERDRDRRRARTQIPTSIPVSVGFVTWTLALRRSDIFGEAACYRLSFS